MCVYRVVIIEVVRKQFSKYRQRLIITIFRTLLAFQGAKPGCSSPIRSGVTSSCLQKHMKRLQYCTQQTAVQRKNRDLTQKSKKYPPCKIYPAMQWWRVHEDWSKDEWGDSGTVLLIGKYYNATQKQLNAGTTRRVRLIARAFKLPNSTDLSYNSDFWDKEIF